MTSDDHCWSQVSLEKESISGDEEPILSLPPNILHLSFFLCSRPGRRGKMWCQSDLYDHSFPGQYLSSWWIISETIVRAPCLRFPSHGPRVTRLRRDTDPVTHVRMMIMIQALNLVITLQCVHNLVKETFLWTHCRLHIMCPWSLSCPALAKSMKPSQVILTWWQYGLNKHLLAFTPGQHSIGLGILNISCSNGFVCKLNIIYVCCHVLPVTR